MAKKKFALVNEQDPKELILHIAFVGNDNPDQILCELPEKTVLELVRKSREEYLPNNFEIDGDVEDYIKEKYSL